MRPNTIIGKDHKLIPAAQAKDTLVIHGHLLNAPKLPVRRSSHQPVGGSASQSPEEAKAFKAPLAMACS
jgi:hypothetical protein